MNRFWRQNANREKMENGILPGFEPTTSKSVPLSFTLRPNPTRLTRIGSCHILEHINARPTPNPNYAPKRALEGDILGYSPSEDRGRGVNIECLGRARQHLSRGPGRTAMMCSVCTFCAFFYLPISSLFVSLVNAGCSPGSFSRRGHGEKKRCFQGLRRGFRYGPLKGFETCLFFCRVERLLQRRRNYRYR